MSLFSLGGLGGLISLLPWRLSVVFESSENYMAHIDSCSTAQLSEYGYPTACRRSDRKEEESVGPTRKSDRRKAPVMALWAETGAAVGAAHFTLTQSGDAMVEGGSLSTSNEARLSHAGGILFLDVSVIARC